MSAPLIDSLGWTLLHFIWQGLLIGTATAAALAMLRRADPRHRYAIACTGLLACLLWPAAELVLRLLGGGMVTAQMRYADALLVGTVNGASGGMLALIQSHLALIVGFWGVCAAVLAARMALGLLWIRRTARAQRSDPQWQAVVSRLALQFGVKRAVRLRVVAQLSTPITAGWWRPVVLVPAALVSGMPKELLEALLAHEMAHVKRLDYLVNLGQSVVEIVLFYHPAVWFISGRIRIAREQIADDLAARHLGQPRRLAQALSELERLQFSGHPLALAASGGHLLSRVKRLLRPDTQALNWTAALPACALALAFLGIYAPASARAPALERQLVDRHPIADFRSCGKPNYPAADLAEAHTGTVTLGFQIAADGRVIESLISKSSGYQGLDLAAQQAIKKCRFIPAMANGKAVQSWTRVQYVWTLD